MLGSLFFWCLCAYIASYVVQLVSIVFNRCVMAPRRRADPFNPTVVIVGAGISGLCMGIRLKQQGVSFVILEKGNDVGGTWTLNRYPGAACDIPSHLYCFSFELKADWSQSHAPQEEILQYLRSVAKKYGLYPHIKFNEAVSSMVWMEESCSWLIRAESGEEYSARVCISATGALHQPSIPAVPGLGRFQGVQMHTAEFDSSYDFANKRVALVGSAASAVQALSGLATKAQEVTVFQRTPNWVSQIYNKHLPTDRYPRWLKLLFRIFPPLLRGHRYSIYLWQEFTFAIGLFDKPGTKRSNRTHAMVQKDMIEEMEKVLQPVKPDLIPKLIPGYPVGCKRILRSHTYYQSLAKDNVHLVASAVCEVYERGVIDASGNKHQCDMILWATGFKVGSMGTTKVTGAGPLIKGRAVAGRKGDTHTVTGSDLVDAGVEAYLGMCLPACPNMFILLGPNTGLGHNSIIFMIECQVNYISSILEQMRVKRVKRVSIQQHVVDSYYKWLWSEMDSRIWPRSCRSWYQNVSGKVTTLWPASCTLYWWRTLFPTLDVYDCVSAKT